MSPRLDFRQLFRETVPVAVIMLFWSSWSIFLSGIVVTGLRYAGIVMVLLYVVVRGNQLAETHALTAHPDNLAGLLRENGHVALLAGVWFLAATLASVALHPAILPLSAAYPSAVNMLSHILYHVSEILEFAFTGTGVATVILYAIAVGLPRCRRHPVEGGNSGDADVYGDD